MSDEWDFYFTRVNDDVSSIFVDLGIRERVPLRRKLHLLWVWVYFNAGRPDGLSSNEEAPTLNKIEDDLASKIAEACGGELVGRITGAGRREFYFYGERADGLEAAVRKAMARRPKYKFDFGDQRDPEWKQYLDVLYPSPRDWQRIMNRRVLENLEKHGDDHSLPRMVDHTAFFKSKQERGKFTAAARKRGFEVGEELDPEEDEGGEHRYGVVLRISHAVDWDRINQVSLSVMELAEEHGGYYDGWGCEVTSAE